MTKIAFPADTLKIESGVPLPIRPTNKWALVFEKMKIGDSVLVPTDKPSQYQGGIPTAAKKYRENGHDGFKITTRAVKDGVRFWRIA